MIAYSVHPSPRTFNWFCLARLFVAGLFGYFYLRLFVSFIPAVAGGAFVMLAGYYMILLTMPELSVESLLPLALWAGERLIRDQTRGNILSFSGSLVLVLLGGMPESAVVTFLVIYAYLLFRLIYHPFVDLVKGRFIASLMLGSFLAICLSAPLIFPFREFMSISVDFHQSKNVSGFVTGLAHEPFGPSIITYMAPMLFGPIARGTIAPAFNGVRGYFGIAGIFFVLLAGSSLIRNRKKTLSADLRPLTVFFLAIVLVVTLKRYGLLINFVGSLPLMQLIQFPKYDEAANAFAVAALIAIGLERLTRGHISKTTFTACALGTACFLPAALFCSRDILQVEILSRWVPLSMLTWAICIPAIAIVFLCSAGLLLLQAQFQSSGIRKSGQLLFVALALIPVLEQMANFVIPSYYVFARPLPTRSDNPYRGAPFVVQLHNWTRDGSRIFARDAILMPAWASAFNLYDVRNLDALYPPKYLDFVRAFISPWDPNNITSSDLIDRFAGSANYQFRDNLSRRLLELSSVKYVISISPVGTPPNLIYDLLSQNSVAAAMKASRQVTVQTVTLGGVAQPGLQEQAPFSRLPYRIFVPDARTALHFSYGVNALAFARGRPDEVGFEIEARRMSGVIVPVFSGRIDAENQPAAGKWFSSEIDLTSFHGQWIDLLLSTDCGHKNNCRDALATWTDFRLLGPGATAEPFHLVYNKECRIYQFDNPLPRASVYYGADLEKNDEAVLRRLKDPTLDVTRRVVLDASQLTSLQRSRLSEMKDNGDRSYTSATFQSIDPAHVFINAILEKSGLLVLNDTAYPGWKAYVDGKETTWFPANSMFRGLFLSPGAHVIEFKYRPGSFLFGVCMALVAVSFIGVWLLEWRWVSRMSKRFAWGVE